LEETALKLKAGKLFLVVPFLAAIAFVIFPVAASAGGEGAQKLALLGQSGNAFCNGSGVFSGTAKDYGSAIFNAPGDMTVTVVVQLEKLAPNQKYVLRLIQGGSDCFAVDHSFTTNGMGNATLYFSEKSTSGHAFIAVDTGSIFVNPTYVTKTYFHS
jgi:hypothetical protein